MDLSEILLALQLLRLRLISRAMRSESTAINWSPACGMPSIKKLNWRGRPRQPRCGLLAHQTCFYFSRCNARQKGTNAKRPLLDKDCSRIPLPLSICAFDDCSAGCAVGISFQVKNLGFKQYFFQKQFDVQPFFC